MSFDGLDPLLDNDGPWETAEYVGPVSSTNLTGDYYHLLEEIYSFRWYPTPLACPGRLCLLHGMEHQHARRQR